MVQVIRIDWIGLNTKQPCYLRRSRNKAASGSTDKRGPWRGGALITMTRRGDVGSKRVRVQAQPRTELGKFGRDRGAVKVNGTRA